MTMITLRQSGGANIVSLPKAITQALGLSVGSELDVSIVDNKLVLTPLKEETTLEALLAESPKESFAITEEDQEWLNMPKAGKEL